MKTIQKAMICGALLSIFVQPLPALANELSQNNKPEIEKKSELTDTEQEQVTIDDTLPETEGEQESAVPLPTEEKKPEDPSTSPESPQPIPETPSVEVAEQVGKSEVTPEVAEQVGKSEVTPELVVPTSYEETQQAPITAPSISIIATRNESTSQFILRVGNEARKIGQENNLYASVMIAQAILESASGNSQLASTPHYNLFGIKGSYRGQSVGFMTQEDNGLGQLYTITSGFKKYPSYKEAMEDYAELLAKGLQGNPTFYKGTWKSETDSYHEATKFLTGKYATDTQYNEKLNQLIATYDLTTYDRPKVETTVEAQQQAERVVDATLNQLGVPYAWGGSTPSGFDCSGLLQYTFKQALNINLPRVTTQQEMIGEIVQLTDLQKGDLLFFGEVGETHHVALYMGDGLFIHAPEPNDQVKVTALSDFMPSFAKRVIGNE